MSFHEVRFPAPLSRGSSGGPERRTEIISLVNGFEERNSPWAHSRRRYDAGLGVRSLDDLAEVVAFFEARHGQLYGFRWKDWSDYKSCLPSQSVSPADQLLEASDIGRTEYPLRKAYLSGDSAYSRPITKPVEGTVRVAIGGRELVADTEFSVDATKGIVRLISSPAADERVTAGFEFDVPVRFDTDRISASLATLGAGEIPSIPIIEVRV